jgi:transposase
MTVEEELALLRAENQELRHQLAQALRRIAELEQQVAALRQRSDPPPSFGKANRPKAAEPKPPRRQRAPQHNHGRPREEPTRIVQHALERCPTCGYRLQGHSLDYRRQVLELPPPQPVEVIEHRVLKRYCPCCRQWRRPRLDLTGQVLGQGRLGVRLVSLIAYLRQPLRLPVRRIQHHLRTLHQLRLSEGEIVGVLHQVRRATTATVGGLLEEARASPVLHADETGWRENGRNGYLWSFSTPGEAAVRYYAYDASRAQAVVKRLLGEECHGHLVSDFYAGYNDYAGPQQRCWVHLLRDLHELNEQHAEEAAVGAWAQAVRALHDDAQAWLTTMSAPSREQREQQYVALVERAHQLGLQYARVKKHPCWALAKRLLRHEDELFQFVLVEGVRADNNLAERSIRPLVVIRKISGGTRSDEGTQTRMALASLFETWQARGLNPFTACVQLLSRHTAPSS